ncbi:TM2 domain-containing protein [Aerosakkonema sp. BLCC-F2]
MQDNPAKSRVTALLLCFFLGGLGIHRFYVGYVTIGIVQLLTFGGCGIWALIDQKKWDTSPVLAGRL